MQLPGPELPKHLNHNIFGHLPGINKPDRMTAQLLIVAFKQQLVTPPGIFLKCLPDKQLCVHKICLHRFDIREIGFQSGFVQ